MKSKIFSFITVSLLIFQPHLSLAVTPSADLVNNFIQAVQKKDKQKIDLAMDELLVNPEAQKILEKDWPNYFTLFNYYKISHQVKELKSDYGASGKTASDIPDVPKANPDKGLPSNRDRAFIKGTPNRILSRQNPPLSNNDAVRQNPNQDQESNQDRIRRRR